MGKKVWYILVGIILLAAGLRLYHITYHDSYTDEAIIAFRSIGLIDYDASPSQTTPWQWFKAVPWWAHLSLSDHPLGFFWAQHLAFTVFGINLLAARLPAVIAGLASVVLIFFIGKKMFSDRAALFAAALIAIQSYMLWVSRLGIQDGAIIALLLLALAILVYVRDNPRWWLALGVVCGLGIITKYTFIIIFPIILLYIASYRLPAWREKYFWYGLILAVIVATPTWLYNIMLYRATGHFDFQISAFLHQSVPQWSFRLGRMAVGTITDRFKNFWLALWYGNSPLFNGLAIIALAYTACEWWRAKNRFLGCLLGATLLTYLWFFVIGSTYRFVVMIVPFLILLIAYLLANLQKLSCRSRLINLSIAVFFLWELGFATNSFLLPRSFGSENIAYAKISEETKNYGFNELNSYIETRLAGRVSALFGQPDYRFLTDIQNKNIADRRRSGAEPYAVLMIYHKNINFVAGLWLFQRHLTYYGWPFMTNEAFSSITHGRYDAYYREQGIKEFIYIAPASDTVLRPVWDRSTGADELKNYLEKKHIVPQIIVNRRGESAFFVYRF